MGVHMMSEIVIAHRSDHDDVTQGAPGGASAGTADGHKVRTGEITDAGGQQGHQGEGGRGFAGIGHQNAGAVGGIHIKMGIRGHIRYLRLRAAFAVPLVKKLGFPGKVTGHIPDFELGDNQDAKRGLIRGFLPEG